MKLLHVGLDLFTASIEDRGVIVSLDLLCENLVEEFVAVRIDREPI